MVNAAAMIRRIFFVLIVGGLVWFFGPLFAIADVRPLESIVNRIVVILVVAAWMLLRFSRTSGEEGPTSNAGYWVIGIPSACLVVLWSISYVNNRAYLSETGQRADQVSDMLAELGSNNRLDALIPVLDEVAALAHDDAVDSGSILWRLGLDQRPAVTEQFDRAYRRLLHTRLLPLQMVLLEKELAEAEQPLSRFEFLDAYLMLASPQDYDAEFLAALFALLNERSDITPDIHVRLGAHIEALFEVPPAPLPMPLDANLITQVRRSLSAQPIEELAYSFVRQEAVNVPDFSVLESVGTNAQSVLTFTSGAPLGRPVAGLFTRRGYEGFWRTEARRIVAEVLTRNRVLGDSPVAADSVEFEQLFAGVEDLYFSDYTRAYALLLSDLELAAQSDPARVALQVENLGPIIQALAEDVWAQVNLQDAPQATDPGDDSRARVSAMLGNAANKGSDVDPRERLALTFAAVNPDTIEPSLRSLDAVSESVNTVLAQSGSGNVTDTEQLRNEIAQLRQLAERRPGFPAQLLLAAADQLYFAFATGTRTALMQADWRQDVYSRCAAGLNGRYPFDRASAESAPLNTFTELFHPDGLLQQFYDAHLGPYVQTDGSTWRLSGAAPTDLRLSAGSIQFFQRADTIRRAYFGNSTTPEWTFRVTPVSMSAAIVRSTLSIGEQSLNYAHGPRVPSLIQWPVEETRLEAQTASDNGAIRLTGPWSWHRLLDQATISRDNPGRWRIGLSLEQGSIEYELQTSDVALSTYTDLSGFRCPESL